MLEGREQRIKGHFGCKARYRVLSETGGALNIYRLFRHGNYHALLWGSIGTNEEDRGFFPVISDPYATEILAVWTRPSYVHFHRINSAPN